VPQQPKSPISRTLTVEECWALVGASGVGRLAVTVGGIPRIVPVNYSVASDVIYFRTAPGTILNNVALQKVAFEVDGIDPRSRPGWSVCVVGSGSSAGRDGPDVDSWAPGARELRYRVVPDAVSGRRLYRSPSS
jgi:hypothetical protein